MFSVHKVTGGFYVNVGLNLQVHYRAHATNAGPRLSLPVKLF